MEEKKPFDQARYIQDYKKEHYDNVFVRIPKGEKEALKSHADSKGESLNAFIYRAITEQIYRDNNPISSETWEGLKSLYQAGKGTDQLSAEEEETLRAIIAKHLK